MAVNIFRDELQHAQLFGKPVLTTNCFIPKLVKQPTAGGGMAPLGTP